MRPDHRQPAIGEPEPQKQHLHPEQEADLRHQERHIQQRGARAGRRCRRLSFSRQPATRTMAMLVAATPTASVVHVGPASAAS